MLRRTFICYLPPTLCDMLEHSRLLCVTERIASVRRRHRGQVTVQLYELLIGKMVSSFRSNLTLPSFYSMKSMAEVRTTNEAGKEEAELKRTNPEDDTSTAEEDDDDDSDMDPSANNVLDRVDKTGENGTNKSDKQTDLMPSDKTVDEGEKDGARLEHSQLDNIPVLSGKENIHDINQQDSLSDEEYESEVDLKEKVELDPVIIAQNELIETATPSTALEVALDAALKRKEIHIQRLTAEILKLKAFVSKRKQTYKRKRKDEGAPTRALSAYNIFIQDRFARLAKENEKALKSEDIDAQLKRVPPANLVAATGNEWKDLSPEVKALYEER